MVYESFPFSEFRMHVPALISSIGLGGVFMPSHLGP